MATRGNCYVLGIFACCREKYNPETMSRKISKAELTGGLSEADAYKQHLKKWLKADEEAF